MRRALVLLFVVFTAGIASASSLTVDTGTNWQGDAYVQWWGYAVYLADNGELGTGVPMSGNLSLFNQYNDRVDNVPWSTLGGMWDNSYTSWLSYSMCYFTAINAATFDHSALDYGNQTCTPPPPRPRDDWDLCETRPWREECGPMCPLIVQTGRGPWSLTDPEHGVLFDLNADGHADRTAWTEAATSLAFVALDLNGNGAIDDGSELFGEHTRLRDGSTAANGFVALAEYDDNGDHTIDAADGVWPLLLLWADANHDGISQPTELQPVGSSNVRALSTSYRWTGRRDRHGNLFRYAATCEADNAAPYYDVFLRVKR